MSVEREQRILELLDEALGRSSREREAFLDEACADDAALRQDLEALLDTEIGDGLLSEPAFSVHAKDEGIGRQIGGYKLVRLLDRGGMGAVYLAEREDFEQRVALKLIRRGLDADEVLVRRFENERQILARLDHPHIARLLDGGATGDRLPYFVMEYVEGVPIDRYCRDHKLTVSERLVLFRKVCSAVQFAHQNLVIHRDLKPGNILITEEGEPKLLDFGIAKLLDQGLAAQTLTTAGQGPMTPRYASPEQIRLEPVTTASDVYSLGVLLYELLTGIDPYGVDNRRSDEVARAICELEPDRPSTAVRRRAEEPGGDEARRLRRRLAGDLDSIVLKAMRKEPGERYTTADQLSDDIFRHLQGLPVGAHTGNFSYRAGKFVRRHRLPLAVVAAFFIMGTSFGITATVLWQRAVEERRLAELERQRAEHEREKAEAASITAERERKRAEAASEILEDFITAADPDVAKGRHLTTTEMLQRGKAKVLEELRTQSPELRIDVTGRLGNVFHKLGAYDDSKEMMQASLQAARQLYGEVHEQVATRLHNLAVLFFAHEDYEEAEDLFRQVLNMRETLDQEAPYKFRSKSNLAMTYLRRGKIDEAEVLCREVLDARTDLYGDKPHDPDVATSRHNLSSIFYARGEFEEAETLLGEALRARRQAPKPERTRIATSLNLLGLVLAAQEREDEAKVELEEALRIRRELLGEDSFKASETRRDLAAVLAGGDSEAATKYAEQALEVFNQIRPNGWDAAEARSVLGMLLTQSGDYGKAEPNLIEGYRHMVELRGRETYRSRLALKRILDLYRAWNKSAEFETYMEIENSLPKLEAE